MVRPDSAPRSKAMYALGLFIFRCTCEGVVRTNTDEYRLNGGDECGFEECMEGMRGGMEGEVCAHEDGMEEAGL